MSLVSNKMACQEVREVSLRSGGELGKTKIRKVATMIVFFKGLKFSRDCFEIDMYFLSF